MARRELRRFLDAGISLTFVFDNRLGVRLCLSCTASPCALSVLSREPVYDAATIPCLTHDHAHAHGYHHPIPYPQLEEDEEDAMKEGTDLDRLLQVSQSVS